MKIKIFKLESKHYVCEKCNQLTDTILNVSLQYSTIFVCINCLKKGVNLKLEIGDY